MIGPTIVTTSWTSDGQVVITVDAETAHEIYDKLHYVPATTPLGALMRALERTLAKPQRRASDKT